MRASPRSCFTATGPREVSLGRSSWHAESFWGSVFIFLLFWHSRYARIKFYRSAVKEINEHKQQNRPFDFVLKSDRLVMCPLSASSLRLESVLKNAFSEVDEAGVLKRFKVSVHEKPK